MIIISLLNTLGCAEKVNVQNIDILHKKTEGKNMNNYDKKYNYSYELIQKDNDLLFNMNLRNITNEDLQVRIGSRFIKISHNGEEIVTSIIFPSYIERPDEVYAEIKSNEYYQYQFQINKEFNLLEGENKYTLDYISEIFDIPASGNFNSKYRKTIEFVWKKDKEGDGGKLISVTYPE